MEWKLLAVKLRASKPNLLAAEGLQIEKLCILAEHPCSCMKITVGSDVHLRISAVWYSETSRRGQQDARDTCKLASKTSLELFLYHPVGRFLYVVAQPLIGRTALHRWLHAYDHWKIVFDSSDNKKSFFKSSQRGTLFKDQAKESSCSIDTWIIEVITNSCTLLRLCRSFVASCLSTYISYQSGMTSIICLAGFSKAWTRQYYNTASCV